MKSNRPSDVLVGLDFHESLFSPFVRVVYYKLIGYEKNIIVSQSQEEEFDSTKQKLLKSH